MTIAIETRLFGRCSWRGDCLVYPGGAESRSGHRQIWFQGGMRLVHRVAWTVKVGDIPDGACVLHRCDNPPCVHVGHLFLGTVADNNRDRDQKGRGKLPTRDQIDRRWREFKPKPLVHGTLSGYVRHKCRCEACREVMREYRKRCQR